MKRGLLLGIAMMIAQPLAHSEAQNSGKEDAKLDAFFKDYLDEEFKHRPLDASRAGDHRFDHLLDDVSAPARAAATVRVRKMLAELPKRIDYNRLTRAGQIDFEIWRHHLQRNLWLADNTKPFEDDPRVYNDYISESVYVLLTQSTEPKPVNIKNAAQRMTFIPRIVAAARASIKNPPKVLTEVALRQLKGAISFYESGIYEIAGETPQLSELRAPAQRILPVLRDYLKFLEEDVLPRSNGEWRLGKEKFAQKLELELDAGVTAEEVLKDAEAEADRVEAEMYVIARQLWRQVFPKKTIPADDADGKRQIIRAVLEEVSKEHGAPADLVKDATATAAKIKAFLRDRNILRLPEPDRCRIVEMPEFQRGYSIAYLNPAPPLDAKASSYYAISPPPRDWDPGKVKSFMQEYNRHMLQLLTIHEAYPGHYVQLEYSNRNPSLIRKVLYSGVFAEGWAVYTEQVMLDEGYGDGDLKLRLNQLKWYLRAVCNAILDYHMHCSGMTDEEALRLLVIRAYQSEGEAILKIQRAKQSSCQLSTYFVGRMAFQRLRRRRQNELGDRFELGRFHEATLAHGTLPVKYLPELVGGVLKR
ncbi:MAG: DUF885 domain-containing protein [Gemmataceae bacterium]|nr:DUF885 domain-containing protein [Gemmataceae bacterium]